MGTSLAHSSAGITRLLEVLFRQPYVNVKRVSEITDLSRPAANALANTRADAGSEHAFRA